MSCCCHANLINLTAEAIGSVFSDPDLLKLIVKHIKRSARVGNHDGHCVQRMAQLPS